MSILKNCIFLLKKTPFRAPHIYSGERTFKRWLAPTLREIKKRKDKMGPQPPPRRSTFLEWNYQAELFAFGKRLNEQFAEEALQQAFTDRSYILQEETRLRELNIESPQLTLTDNQSLVEVGEQLTSETVRRCIRAALPRIPEECVTCAHSYLMSEEVLAHVSSGIGTRDLILAADSPPEPATLAKSFKAVVGALEKSSGRDRAVKFVMDLVVTQLRGKNLYEMWSPGDPLAIVTAVLSRQGAGPPEPRLLGKAAPNTVLATYHVGVYSDKQLLGAGWGETVTIAVESAAHNVLQRFFGATDTFRPLTAAQIVEAEETLFRSLEHLPVPQRVLLQGAVAQGSQGLRPVTC